MVARPSVRNIAAPLKDPTANVQGRYVAAKGRANNLAAEKRQEIAKTAAAARWGDMETLTKLIRDVLLEQFPDAGIDRVFVASGLDSDGDNILRVTVGLSGKDLRGRERLVGATRHVMTKLAEAGNSDFPILSFVSTQEMGKIRRAAA